MEAYCIHLKKKHLLCFSELIISDLRDNFSWPVANSKVVWTNK